LSNRGKTLSRTLRHPEWFLVVSLGTCLAFLIAGKAVEESLSRPATLAVVFVWLFGVILGSAICVVRQAECIAGFLGEPYGTLVLTLSVTFIEVASISAVMLHGENNPTLVRDTLIAVVMIILNGMVGASLMVGAWKYGEQHYNLQGANAYLGVIIPLVVLAMIMPDYTVTTVGPTLSRSQETMLALIMIGLYVVFLAVQTGRYHGYFGTGDENAKGEQEGEESSRRSLPYAVVMLLLFIAPVVYLAEQLAKPIDYLIETLHAPAALGGVMIAVLVATPEAIGAVRAALANKVQRSVNIFLGSVLSTMGLTVPAMLVISHWTNHPIVLGVEHASMVLLLLTLALCIVTFSSGHTNVLQGVVHLLLFLTFLFLLVQG
jgi:Ca2+:H+ antiporter